jgi:hypothetical protein
VDGLGRFHLAETDDFSSDVYATGGTHIMRIENEAPRIRVDDDLLDPVEGITEHVRPRV